MLKGGEKVVLKLVGCGLFWVFKSGWHGTLFVVHGRKKFHDHGTLFEVVVLNPIELQSILIILEIV